MDLRGQHSHRRAPCLPKGAWHLRQGVWDLRKVAWELHLGTWAFRPRVQCRLKETCHFPPLCPWVSQSTRSGKCPHPLPTQWARWVLETRCSNLKLIRSLQRRQLPLSLLEVRLDQRRILLQHKPVRTRDLVVLRWGRSRIEQITDEEQ